MKHLSVARKALAEAKPRWHGSDSEWALLEDGLLGIARAWDLCEANGDHRVASLSGRYLGCIDRLHEGCDEEVSGADPWSLFAGDSQVGT